MPTTSTYYKAIRKAINAVSASPNQQDSLAIIVRITAQTLGAAASFVGLDSSRKHLIHQSSWGLSHFYMKKGPIDVSQSLPDVTTKEPVLVSNVATSKHVQYPEIAIRAGITSILGVPVISSDEVLGSLRVYSKRPRDCSPKDNEFVLAMASLIATVLDYPRREESPGNASSPQPKPQRAGSIKFAHPSEYEFARLLDFYGIEWFYEPRSFPLKWDKGQPVEMFTPDFYLPGLDLYVELTTMKQHSVTTKNRKLRLLRKLYPEVQVALLYKNDYDRLLARYGCGPLSHTRAHGINQVLYQADEIEQRVRDLAVQISQDYASKRPVLVGVQRGFLCFMADLIRQITIPLDIDFMATSYYNGDSSAIKITKDLDLNITGRHILIIEDIIDTGITLNYILSHLTSKSPADLAVCTLLDRKARRLVSLPLRYIGFNAPDEFLVGYGLDYREEYRNLPFIGIPTIESVPQTEKEKDEL